MVCKGVRGCARVCECARMGGEEQIGKGTEEESGGGEVGEAVRGPIKHIKIASHASMNLLSVIEDMHT